MNLAENLQKQRKMHGLSQEELAEKCDISRQAIAKWESGDSTPSIDKLIFLADLYDISLDELVGRVVLDDYDRFASFVKKCVPSEIRFGKDDDISAVVIRYFDFMQKMNISADDSLNGMKEIFLTGIVADQKTDLYSTLRTEQGDDFDETLVG